MAVPWDKGNGYCIMREEDYDIKISEIMTGKQFLGYEVPKRKNAKEPIFSQGTWLYTLLFKCVRVCVRYHFYEDSVNDYINYNT